MYKNILILGGYGNTGSKIAHLLLQYSDVNVTLAGRNITKANALADELNNHFNTDRVSTVFVDAADEENLRKVCKEVDFLVVASSTSEYTKKVATAALETGIDYLDVQYSTEKLVVLQSMAEKIEKAGCCFITEAGFHPGLLAPLVRFGALSFDQLQIAIIGGVIYLDWKSLKVSPSTKREFVKELADFQSLFYENGRWEKASLLSTKDFVKIDFGGDIGEKLCTPMFFEELISLPDQIPSLTHMGFYVAGFHWFVDMVVMPLVMGTLKLFPNRGLTSMGKLMGWSLSTFSKPPYQILLQLEAKGIKEGKVKRIKIQLSHDDGYWFTAIPVMACLIQYLDGSIKKPGLNIMGHLVDPARLMKDMQRMGITINEEKTSRS